MSDEERVTGYTADEAINEAFGSLEKEIAITKAALRLACTHIEGCPKDGWLTLEYNECISTEEASHRECPNWDKLNEHSVNCWTNYFLTQATPEGG